MYENIGVPPLGSESSYKAMYMYECQKIPERSTAVFRVVSLFESYS